MFKKILILLMGLNSVAFADPVNMFELPKRVTLVDQNAAFYSPATAAKQPALGTAGSASSDVLSVQGITSMTPLKTDGSGFTQPVSGTVSAAQSGTWNINNISGTVALPTGAASAANQSTELSSLSTIATNTGNGATSANQTNGNQKTQITNGTQSADTVGGDSGQNGLIINPSRKEVSFTTTTAQAVASTDVSNYRYASVYIVTQGTTSTVSPQCSNDNTNWASCSLGLASTTSGQGVSVGTTASNIILSGTIPTRYFRLNVTGISAGTTAGVIEFFSVAPSENHTAAYSSQSGSWIVGMQPAASASTNSPTETTVSTAYEASHVVKSSSGTLFSLICYNSKASAQFIETFNSTTLPTDGTVSVTTPIACPASSNCTLDFGNYGKFYSTGIVWSNSSTSPTKTIGSADVFCEPRYQ